MHVRIRDVIEQYNYGIRTLFIEIFTAEVTCSSLAIPTDGFITYSPDTTSPFSSQTTATYSCANGYGLSGGDRSRTCMSSNSGPGEWNGNAPSCEGKPILLLAHFIHYSLYP